MGAPIISINGLGKKYQLGAAARSTNLRESIAAAARRLAGKGGRAERPEFWALRDVTFEVQPGEAIGIVGRNGAGKSTLLKILSQITDPTEGEIRIRGRVASLLEVGTGFHSELTGRENIFLNGAILGLKRAEIRAKFDAIVDFAGVEKFIDTPVKHYSSGMYVRLAFAVAAHLEPEILVIDEVLAVGDAAFQAKCLAKMDDITSGEGRTVLFVSHNLAAVQSLCRTGVLLERGRLVERGPITQILDAYQRVLLGSGEQGDEAPVEVPPDSARIVDWHLLGAATGEKHACFARETCQFVFTVESRVAAAEVSAGFLLHNSQGEMVCGATSRDQKPATFSLAPGRHELIVTLALPLRPGIYHLDVSLNDRDRGQLDRAQPRATLNILPHGATALPPKYQGLLNVPAIFNLRAT